MAKVPKAKTLIPDPSEEESGVRADVPDELFEEALRSIERIERELRANGRGGPAPVPTPRERDLPEAGEEPDLDALARLLDAAEPETPMEDTGIDEAVPEAVEPPEEERAARPQAAEELAGGDEIIAKLLARHAADEAPEAAAQRPAVEQDERLRELIAVKEDQLRELMERFKRLQSDFEKYRQRIDRDRDDQRKFAGEDIIRRILPIADSFERALAHARTSGDPKAFAEGVELIYKQFQDVLSNLGLTPIRAVGEAFDPQFHEAMLHLEDPEASPNAVVSEYEKGYLLHGRLLRPAKVVVAKGSGPNGGRGA